MKYNKTKAVLGGLLKSLQVEFFGVFVMLFFWAVSKAFGLFANIMFGITGLACIVCIMADYGLKQGQIAKQRVKFHDDSTGRNFGLVIGAVSMIPTYLTMIFLVLSKIGVIGNFLPLYKILNASYFPFFDIISHTADITEMTPYAFIMAGLFPLLYMFPTWIAFKISYDEVDVKEKIVYK